MAMDPNPLVIGVFQREADAELAIEDLCDAGFEKNQLGLATREKSSQSANLLAELMNLGVSQDRASYYDNEYNSGLPVVSVRPDGRDQDAINIIGQHGGMTDFDNRGMNRSGAGQT